MTVGSQILSKFGRKADDPLIIQKCEDLIGIFNFSVEELFINWESYVLTSASDVNLQLSPENLEKLKDYLQQKLVQAAAQKNNSATPMMKNKIVRPVARGNINGSSPLMGLNTPSTPVSSRKKRKLVTPSSSSATPSKHPLSSSPIKKSVQVSGKIIESLNDHIPSIGGLQNDTDHTPNISTSKVTLTANFDPKKYQFRTMRQKLLDTADVLDEQIDSMAKTLQKHHKIAESDFGNPCIASQFSVYCCGRIVPDSPFAPVEIRLNPDSLFLETSRLGGIGQRISIDVQSLAEYSFFPGQIVGFKGKNPSGERFIVEQVLDIPYLGAPVSNKTELLEFKTNLDGSSMKTTVLSGPYTPSTKIDYSLLESFVQKLNTEIKPHSVIMFGPFLDITHPSIRDGSIESVPELQGKKVTTLDNFFRAVITPILKKIDSRIQVILIPSTRDSISSHAAYPQNSFERKSLQLPKNFKCFPNPCSFQLNECLIGVSNLDSFKDIKDVNRGKIGDLNRFDRIADHILQQRRYYPCFPGSLKTRKGPDGTVEHISGADLDMPYMGLSELYDVLPDVLIIPSEMRYFVRVVKNVVVINPGHFLTGNNAGTYVTLSVKPPNPEVDEDDLTCINEDDRLYIHNIWKRARVDIINV
ncbi:hypothetical protein LJB42_003818 [Komagataella kurtzmanii]|nr:hypothetical protein LJB42_003818 [Komagataella kurtzmanii]